MVDNIYLPGSNQESPALLKAMPKIPEREAELLYGLLSKIFIYDPERRPTASELLSHPRFYIDSHNICTQTCRDLYN
jgi:serine/threonine protein kinase